MRRVKRRDSKRVPSTVQSAQSHGRAHERGPVPDPVEGAVRRTWRVAIWRPTHLMSVLQGPTAQISQLNTLLSPYRLLPGPFSWLGLPLSPLFTVLTRDVRDGTVARHTSDTTRAHDTRTWTWTWTWFASSRPVRPTKDGPTVIWPPAGRGDDPDPIRHIAHRARRRWQGEGQRGRGRRVRRRQRVRRQQHSLEKLL